MVSMFNIKLLVTDCDGCLTDGMVPRRFNVKDGLGLQLVRSVILTSSKSLEIQERANDLGIRVVVAKRKLDALTQICKDHGIRLDEVMYIGDDLPDLECIRAAGIGAAPRDAVKEVKKAAAYVARKKGGSGAVREIIDLWRRICEF